MRVRIIDNDCKPYQSLLSVVVLIEGLVSVKYDVSAFSFSDMIIGFTQRVRTVSESSAARREFSLIDIDVATQRLAEREHPMVFYLWSSRAAIVEFCIIIIKVKTSHFTGAVVSLEQTLYRVDGGLDVIQVCANISFPPINCPVKFPFEVGLATVYQSASMFYILLLCNNINSW